MVKLQHPNFRPQNLHSDRVAMATYVMMGRGVRGGDRRIAVACQVSDYPNNSQVPDSVRYPISRE